MKDLGLERMAAGEWTNETSNEGAKKLEKKAVLYQVDGNRERSQGSKFQMLHEIN